jgi:hypothetical protein
VVKDCVFDSDPATSRSPSHSAFLTVRKIEFRFGPYRAKKAPPLPPFCISSSSSRTSASTRLPAQLPRPVDKSLVFYAKALI